MWVLKLQDGENNYRIPLEQQTFQYVAAALNKSGQDVSQARYIDEDGDHCTLCEATFSDFLETAAINPGSSKTQVLKLVMATPSVTEPSWTVLGSEDGKKKTGRRGRSSSSKGSGRRGRGRGRKGKRSSSGSGGSSSSSGSSHSRRSHSRGSHHSSRSRSHSRGSHHSSRSRSRSKSRGKDIKVHFEEEGKITFILQESFGRDGRKMLVPGGSKMVQRAFYGDGEHLWDESKGKDVTEVVKKILDWGYFLQAQNDMFGDPVHHCEKVLVVEVAIPPSPVSALKAHGFIKLLKAKYLNEHESGDSPSLESYEPWEITMLKWLADLVKADPTKAIPQIARSWGVKAEEDRLVQAAIDASPVEDEEERLLQAAIEASLADHSES